MSPDPKRRPRGQILVRHGVIAALALLGLLILTAYLREARGGPLHEFQADTGDLVSPIKSAATRAVEPLRDGWSWTTGLRSAREDAKRLQRENAELIAQLNRARARSQQLEEELRIASVEVAALEDDYEPLAARVVGRSVSNLYSRATLDIGSDDGVVVRSPVIAPDAEGAGALVGHVAAVSAQSSIVTFITDPRTRIGARLLNAQGGNGVVSATTSGSLLMSNVQREWRVAERDVVVTAGFSDRLPSVYPPNIPIGTVVGVGGPEGDSYPPIQVDAYVDPRALGQMIVLRPISDRARRRVAG